MKKKTQVEYKAAAMLIGGDYDPVVHSIWLVDHDSNNGPADTSRVYEWDADTMELLNSSEIEERRNAFLKEHGRVSVTPDDGGSNGD